MSQYEDALSDQVDLSDQAALSDQDGLPEEAQVEFENVLKAIQDLKWESVPGEIDRMVRLQSNIREHPIQTWPQDTAALEQQRDALHSIITLERSDGCEITEILRLNTMKALIKAIPAGELRTKVINMPDSNHRTALQLAVLAANPALSVIEYLIKHGADRYEDTLRTPIDIARLKGRQASEGVISLIHGGDEQEHGSSSVPKCDVYTVKKFVIDNSRPRKKWRWRAISTRTLDKPVTEVLNGPFSLLEEFRRRHREIEVNVFSTETPTTLPEGGEHWLSCWLHLPERNLEWIKAAARQIFSPKSGSDPESSTRTLDDILKFITHMGDSKSLAKPGNYFPGVYGFDLADEAKVQCIVLPILDIDNHPLHRRQAAQAFGANEQQALFDDKTLDDYCYEFLEENEVQRRNGDQVFSRYSKRLEKKMMMGK